MRLDDIIDEMVTKDVHWELTYAEVKELIDILGLQLENFRKSAA